MKFSDLLTPEQKAACDFMVEDFDMMCANYLERVVTDAAKHQVAVAVTSLTLEARGIKLTELFKGNQIV